MSQPPGTPDRTPDRTPDAHAPPWWHPLRSDPAVMLGIGFGVHVLAILLSMVATVVSGLALWLAGAVLMGASEALGGALAALALVMVFSVMFTWAGHIPGALILHALLRQGWGGWAMALLGGLAVGAVLGVMGSPLTQVLGPLLAVLHLFVLRALAWQFMPGRA